MKVKPKDVLAFVIVGVCSIFMWNGKDGIIVAMLLTVVTHYFGELYRRVGKRKDDEE